MTHDPTRRTQRQREARRAERQQERHITDNGLRGIVAAIGGGDVADWDQDQRDEGDGDE